MGPPPQAAKPPLVRRFAKFGRVGIPLNVSAYGEKMVAILKGKRLETSLIDKGGLPLQYRSERGIAVCA